MIAVDTNILVHADRAGMSLHHEAVHAIRRLSEGDEAWALPIFCVGEFIRVVSHPRVFDPPTSAKEAVTAVSALFESPSLRLLYPGERFWALFAKIVGSGAAQGNLVFDAQIAALCLEHGADTILTEDRDFARFPGITVRTLAEFGAFLRATPRTRRESTRRRTVAA